MSRTKHVVLCSKLILIPSCVSKYFLSFSAKSTQDLHSAYQGCGVRVRVDAFVYQLLSPAAYRTSPYNIWSNKLHNQKENHCHLGTSYNFQPLQGHPGGTYEGIQVQKILSKMGVC
jgi:hypothetical protein